MQPNAHTTDQTKTKNDKAAAASALHVDQAAERLNLARSTVYRFVRQGIVKGVKVGGRVLIPAAEIDRLLREGGQRRSS